MNGEQYAMEEPFDGIPCYTNRDSFDVPDGFWDDFDRRLDERYGKPG